MEENPGFNGICCAPGRIRTYVATWASDLQSDAIDRSATDANCLILYTL